MLVDDGIILNIYVIKKYFVYFMRLYWLNCCWKLVFKLEKNDFICDVSCFNICIILYFLGWYGVV